MTDLLEVFKQDGYRIGDLQIILYDRRRVDVFPAPYLTKLYNLAKASGRREGMGILPNLFCGMTDLSHDALTSYLANLPVILFVKWTSENTFKEAGFAFPANLRGDSPERMAFMAYGFFREFWGSPDLETLMLLGLVFTFLEFKLNAIHGIRYQSNRLTAKFMKKFGFRETGCIPRYMMQDGKLATGVVSSLLREEFEGVVMAKLVKMFDQGFV